MSKLKPLVALSLLTLTSPCLYADNSTWINLGGISKHSEGNYQEVNQGLGYDLPVTDNTRLGVGGYRNSYNRSSNYLLGYSTFKTHTLYPNSKVKLGLVYGIISGYFVDYVPVVSPTLTMEYKNIGLMFTYFPDTGINNTSVVAMQVRVRVL